MAKYRTWNWQDLNSWKEDVFELMSDILKPAVIEEFLRDPPEYLVCDELAWLDDIVDRVTGAKVDTKRTLEQRLRSHYFAIRAFHGTRSADTTSYYERGLLPLNGQNFENLARTYFLSPEFPEITEENLANAIRTVGRDGREGRLYFEAGEKFLIERCGHYMLYGSEYVCAIAAHLAGTKDYRQALKNRGTPTIFECDIPLSLVNEPQLLAFSGLSLESMFNSLINPDHIHPTPGRGAAISLRSPLNPEYIVNHRKVDNVPDRLAMW